MMETGSRRASTASSVRAFSAPGMTGARHPITSLLQSPESDMPKYSPELVASVVHDYVHTDKSTRQIAADHEINERGVTRIRHAAGIQTRRTRARELPAAMREASEISKRLKAAAPYGCRPGDAGTAEPGTHNLSPVDRAESVVAMGSGLAPLARPGMTEDADQASSPENVPSIPALIARVARLVEQELAAEEETRAELGMLARTPTELERCARIVASMTRTLHQLVRLRASAAPEQGSNNVDDYPADIDAFRDEFARRIRAFVASRIGAGSAAAAGPA